MSTLAPSRARLESLAEVFARGRAENPDGPALRDGEREVGYCELDALIGWLAEALSDLGVCRGQRLVIWLPKSIEAIAVMQAAVRIGAVYVPIDPLSPPERVRCVLSDCRPAACVALKGRVEGALCREPPDFALLELSRLGGGWESQRDPRASDPPRTLDARCGGECARPGFGDELAYILYTSGSTGTPKGVCISHRAALAFIEWAHGELAPWSEDRFANHAPLHFDLSVLDIYVAFLAGACVCLIPEAVSFMPTRLVDFVRDERITIWYSVPSALTLMVRTGLPEYPPAALHTVLFAGEPFPIEPLRALRRALPRARLLNLYGPTETNVCAFHEVGEIGEDADQPVPIGRACSGDSIWIEDLEGRPMPVGACGELVVEGPTVMRGYWGAPPHCGPYRTGDLVERISEDSFRFLGRRDALVKVRGHRVELAEVEAAIACHEDLLEAAVVVFGEGLESRLVAAVVARGHTTPNLLEIKRWCAPRLPRYMIVHELRVLAELPRGPNGKLDRRALTERLLAQEPNR
jgi:amino acid adenylation domain-containing protein